MWTLVQMRSDNSSLSMSCVCQIFLITYKRKDSSSSISCTTQLDLSVKPRGAVPKTQA